MVLNDFSDHVVLEDEVVHSVPLCASVDVYSETKGLVTSDIELVFALLKLVNSKEVVVTLVYNFNIVEPIINDNTFQTSD